jgi:hypothetical protein
VITPFLLELCDYIDEGGEDFEGFDDRFYEIEEVYELRKNALKYYKENFGESKMNLLNNFYMAYKYAFAFL